MGLWYCEKCNTLTNITVCPKCGKETTGAFVADFKTAHTIIAKVEEDNYRPMTLNK